LPDAVQGAHYLYAENKIISTRLVLVDYHIDHPASSLQGRNDDLSMPAGTDHEYVCIGHQQITKLVKQDLPRRCSYANAELDQLAKLTV
jgi:hypothetical protein